MKAKTAVLLSLSVILLASAVPAIPGYPALLARPTPGLGLGRKFPAGEIYKSPKHVFTIVSPHPNSETFDFSGWEVLYESDKDNHEMVTFAEYDFAQTYRAGIVKKDAATVDLHAVAHAAAISRKHQMGVPFDFVEESKVNTQFGEGSLRVYSMKGGSLDMIKHGADKPQFHDSYVAVLLVPQEGRILFAVMQDDNWKFMKKISDDDWKMYIKDRVQAFFATMTLGN